MLETSTISFEIMESSESPWLGGIGVGTCLVREACQPVHYRETKKDRPKQEADIKTDITIDIEETVAFNPCAADVRRLYSLIRPLRRSCMQEGKHRLGYFHGWLHSDRCDRLVLLTPA